MVLPLLLGSFVIIINVFIQSYGNVIWLRRVTPFFKAKEKFNSSYIALRVLSSSFLFLTFLHLTQTLIWASAYRILPETSTEFSNFLEAWYFSIVTFTTLGYGDIILHGKWRLLSGIEAINGIMLIGWSTAMMYSLIQQLYKKLNSN